MLKVAARQGKLPPRPSPRSPPRGGEQQGPGPTLCGPEEVTLWTQCNLSQESTHVLHLSPQGQQLGLGGLTQVPGRSTSAVLQVCQQGIRGCNGGPSHHRAPSCRHMHSQSSSTAEKRKWDKQVEPKAISLQYQLALIGSPPLDMMNRPLLGCLGASSSPGTLPANVPGKAGLLPVSLPLSLPLGLPNKV